MPLLRGKIHELTGAPNVGLAILTNDRWNSAMSQVGAALVRPEILPVEEPYAVELGDGRFATAARVISLQTPAAEPDGTSPFGPAQGSLSTDELRRLEDALLRFLQLPLLLRPVPQLRRPVGDASRYANWGELYVGNQLTAGERKRFIVVSPNEWNAATGVVSAIRTTSKLKLNAAQFPKIQGGRIHACCGDLTTFGPGALLLRRQSRPTPATSTLAEMVAIARGLVITHDLGGALARADI